MPYIAIYGQISILMIKDTSTIIKISSKEFLRWIPIRAANGNGTEHWITWTGELKVHYI
jgi:hypothetical protein